MSRSLNLIVILLFSSVSNSASLLAQTSDRSNPPIVAPVLNLEAVHLGATMRVKTAGKTSEGKVSEIRGDSLWLSSTASRVGLSMQTVDSAWTLERQPGKGMAIGAIAGGVLFGGFIGIVYYGLCDSTNCRVSESIGPALVGGLVGAVGGAVIGAGAGSLVKRWKRWLP